MGRKKKEKQEKQEKPILFIYGGFLKKPVGSGTSKFKVEVTRYLQVASFFSMEDAMLALEKHGEIPQLPVYIDVAASSLGVNISAGSLVIIRDNPKGSRTLDFPTEGCTTFIEA